jgi:RNA polymerase sigma-70 factor, ECF subfamily
VRVALSAVDRSSDRAPPALGQSMIGADDRGDPLGPFRSELRAHCYRMLGSFQDAEDVLQEVSLRAWRSRNSFENRSSLRTWLHRIAANACLNELQRKERRVLPMDFGGPAEPHALLREPLGDIQWLEPFPDDPEQSVVERESVELAFVAAVQYLPANQRAALIMFDVLGFSAAEIADAMDTTPTSVHSALQRARSLIDARVPEGSQRATLAALGHDGQRKLVEGFTAALERHDIDSMLSLLTEDATWSMPPIPTWFRGLEAIAAFCVDAPFNYRWRCRPAQVNGQLALGCYWWVETAGAYVAYSLNVFDVRGDRISSIVSFIDGERFPSLGLPSEISG